MREDETCWASSCKIWNVLLNRGINRVILACRDDTEAWFPRMDMCKLRAQPGDPVELISISWLWRWVWFCGLRQLSLDLVVQLGIKLEALLCPQYWLFRSSSIDCLVPVALVALLLPRWGMLSILKTCMQAAKAFHLFSLKPLYLVVCFPWKLDELTGYFLFFLICSLIIINVHLLVFCWLYNKLSDICKSYWCKLLKYMSIKL
jgi:hypothetical protein